MHTTVAGRKRPETLLESAQVAEKATLELNMKLGVLIKAINSEGPTLGKAAAESVEFEECESVEKLLKLANAENATMTPPHDDKESTVAEDHSLWCSNDLPAPLITISSCGCSRYDTEETGANSLWAAMCSAIDEHPMRTLAQVLEELQTLLEHMGETPTLRNELESLSEQVKQARNECSQISIDATNIRCVHEADDQTKRIEL